MALDRGNWDLARTWERDRYLAALRAPRQTREALLALAAYAAELRRIPDLVSEPMLGEIRLQWWRDAVLSPVDDAVAGTGGHPLAERLRSLVAKARLPEGLLLGLVDARAGDLYGEAPADDGELAAFLGKTESAQFDLAARVLGAAYSQSLADATLQAGHAYGLARMLHELPIDLAQGRVRLPLDRFAAHGIEPHGLLRGEAGPPLASLVDELAVAARGSLQLAVGAVQALPKGQQCAFLPLVMVEPYLKAAADQVMGEAIAYTEINPLQRVWRIWRGLPRR